MTKVEFIDYISSMTGYRHHEKVIEYSITQAYGQMVHDYLNGVIDSFQYWTKEYTEQAVTLDATKDLYYTDLPAAVVSIGSPTGAVREINTNQGQGLNFFPMGEDDWEYFYGLDSETTNSDIGYEIIGDKVWYFNMDDDIATVRMVLAIPFNEFDATDEVTMPAGRDYDITRLTIELLNQSNPKTING